MNIVSGQMAGAAEHTPLLKQRVRIDGLSARPDLNGQFGKAVKFVSETGRYGVMLENGRETIALKPANLSAASASEVRHACGQCGALDAQTACSKCFAVWYCNQECAELAKEGHKQHCISPPMARPNDGKEKNYDTLQEHMMAAASLSNAGQLSSDQEIKMWQQEIAMDPQQPMPYCNLALAHSAKGSKREAVVAMDKAFFYVIAAGEEGAMDMSADEAEQ